MPPRSRDTLQARDDAALARSIASGNFQSNFSAPPVTNAVNPSGTFAGLGVPGAGNFTGTGFGPGGGAGLDLGFGLANPNGGLTTSGFGNLNQVPSLLDDATQFAPNAASSQGFNLFGQEQNGAFVPGIVPQVAGLGLGLAQTFLGFEQLGLAEDQFALQTEAFRDQQRVAAQENDRLQAARASASRA